VNTGPHRISSTVSEEITKSSVRVHTDSAKNSDQRCISHYTEKTTMHAQEHVSTNQWNKTVVNEVPFCRIALIESPVKEKNSTAEFMIKIWSFARTCLHGCQKCVTLAVTLQIWRHRHANVPYKVGQEQSTRNSKRRNLMHSPYVTDKWQRNLSTIWNCT
jgi:hypothetical protein